MTLWTATKQLCNGRLLNPRLSSNTERLNRRARSVDAPGVDVALCIRARAEEITRGRGGAVVEGGDERGDEEPNEYDIVTIRANAVSFAPSHPSLFAR